MNVTLRSSQGVVAVTDDVGPDTRTVHKYALVQDGRRRGISSGKHAVNDLSGVVVEHKQTTTIHRGRVVDINWKADPDASRELVQLGADVRLSNTETSDPRGISA